MKYFLHDTNAFDDEKITQLFIKFGYEGIGLFYTILEKIAKQEKPVKTEVLIKQLRVGKKLLKCWNFMEEIGLISSNNGETFNKQLLNYSEKYSIKKEKNAKRISEWRKNQEDTENVTRYEQVCNTPKVNKSKVNRIEDNHYIFEDLKFCSSEFLEIWNILIKEPKWKKKSRNALEMALKKLNQFDEQTAIQMMQNTISGGYQGLFEIKNSVNNTKHELTKTEQIIQAGILGTQMALDNLKRQEETNASTY